MVIRNLIAPLATAALLAGLSTGAVLAQDNAKAGGTFTVAVGGDLKSLDPLWTAVAITGWYANQVCDMLFAFDEGGQIQPQMVGDYSVSEDGLTHDFTLRAGLKFHDGTPVRAADAAASIKRWGQRDGMGRLLLSKIASLEAVDDNTFRMVLSEPFGLVREALGKLVGPPYIMPERLASMPADQEIKESVCSGPYKFAAEEWVPGNRAVFVKNQDYVPRDEPASGLSGGKIVNFDRMEWRYIPDENTKLSAITVGEVDYYDAPPLDFVPLFEADPNLQLVFNDPFGVQVLLRPNHLYPPFDNKLARQALLYLINQEQVMQAIVGGQTDLYLPYCGAYFMCGSANDTEAGAEQYREVNIERAKALLAEAGYKGEPVVIMQPTDRQEHNAATLVAIQALRDAGINLDVQAADWATISGRRNKKDAPADGGWNLFITAGLGVSQTDPIINLWFVPSCENAMPGWACSPEIMALIDEWSTEYDLDKKRALIDQIQTLAYQEVPYIPMGQYRRPHGARADIKGLLTSGPTVFWNAYRETAK